MKYTSSTLKFSISGLRGVYPADISPDKWVDYVRAFAAVLPAGPIAIARDARATGPALVAIASGVLRLLGREVHDLGLVPTPTIKAYVAGKKCAGALMVSASHNPAEYNALKFIGKGGFFFSAADNARFSSALDAGAEWGDYRKQGRLVDAHQTAMDFHISSILKVVKKPRRRLTVVIDPVGSCGGAIALELLRRLGVRTFAIHLAETPAFPRPPEPTAEALGKLGAAVRRHKADIGFAFDPDADRLSLVDEKGRAIGEEYTLPLAILAAAKPKGKIVANLSTSMLTESAAEMRKCTLIRSEVGEANVVAQMLKDKSQLGGEGNGGVIDARVPSFGRDALTGVAHILSLVASARRPLSAWVASLPPFVMTKQVIKGVSADEMRAIADKVMGRLTNATLDTRDGFHVSGSLVLEGTYTPCWLHLRSSNTEPVVRLIAEAQGRRELETLLGYAKP